MSAQKTPGQRMYAAVENGGSKEVSAILREYPDELYESPGVAASWLHFAAEEGHQNLINVFLEAGLKVNHRSHPGGDTPLTDAVRAGKYETVQYLLSLGADPSAGRSLIAAINGKARPLELIKLLVENGANVNECWHFGDDREGPIFNALSWATSHNRDDIAEYLKAHGAVAPHGPDRRLR